MGYGRNWTEHLPAQVKRYIAENDIKFYTIDGIKIGKEIGLGGRINTVLAVCILCTFQHHSG